MPPKRSKLPVPLPEGLIVTDTNKKSWKLGKKLGQGGFGLIYLASSDCDVKVPDGATYVIKVENYQNGPLFCELKFYQRAAKQDDVKKWIHSHSLDYLGIPRYWGTGETTCNSSSYRFMVVDRLGMDLQKLQNDSRGRLPAKTVMQISIRMLDVLEYIHEHEYVHGDIKAGNILLHTTDTSKVYLADYGLSYRYCPNGKHKEYKEDPRKCHNGTIEFTSRDAHKGVAPSRRGDLEILAHCMLHWLSGKLPWDQSLRDPSTVLASKTKLWDDLPNSVTEWSGREEGCQELAKFMAEVSLLTYNEKPNYAALKRILLKALDSTGTSLNSPLITSDTQSFQKLSTGVGKKSYPKKKTVNLCTNDDKDEYDPNFGTSGMQGASSNLKTTSHEVVYSEVPSDRKPKSYPKKIMVNRCTSYKDEYDPNVGTSHMQGASRNSQRTSHDDTDVKVLSVHTPMRTLNACDTQDYKLAANEDSWCKEANIYLKKQTSSTEPDLHRQDRQDIYKYGLAVPVLLLMIYYLIYVL